jgi:hypothetical protein
MTTNIVEKIDIDSVLTDSIIHNDLIRVLWEDEEGHECEIEFEEGNIVVPEGVVLEVISKVYRKNIYMIGFGSDYFYSLVAIGGIKKISGGIIIPTYCFATLFYNYECKLITVDFHSEMR